ncbi:MAG: sensor histidine kinase, partial [Spirochaetales bacterium]|nr:sensor histidine kinase [Spirochaetales bacterium]
FVLLPVITAAIGYGLYAGVAAGAVALPANLLLYQLLGHPEYSPASKLIAELSGIVVGTVLGYLSDYHRKLDAERSLRKRIEDELRAALRDKEALFREVHHRVKNNLNLIKSIINLQSRRSADPAFKRAAAALNGRLLSISFVHERLYRTSELADISINDYLTDLVSAIRMSIPGRDETPDVTLSLASLTVTMDVAVPLGIVVNETLNNALRHGNAGGTTQRIELSLEAAGRRLTLVIRDNGAGFTELAEDTTMSVDELALANPEKLGFTLVSLMEAQLSGTGTMGRNGGWTEYRLECPAGAGAS